MKAIVINDIENDKLDWDSKDLYTEDEITTQFQKEYKPQAKDRLFIHSDCTIPRFKLKSLCDKYDIAISKTADKANVIVHNRKNFTDTHFSHYWLYKIHAAGLLSKLDSLAAHKGPSVMNNLREFTAEVRKENLEYIYIDWGACYKFDDDTNDYYYPTYNENDEESARKGAFAEKVTVYEIKVEGVDLNGIKNMYTGKQLIDEKLILELIGDLFPTMDKEMYEGARSLFNSGSSGDISIAMETMANCNPSTSMAYLLLLYYEFGRNEIRNHDHKNHVNFKSLTKYLNVDMYQKKIDNVIDTLKDKGKLTSKNMAIVMEEARKIVKESGDTDYFIASEVSPTPEIQRIMQETDAKQNPVEAIEQLLTTL